jgi:hypothetical protein
MVCTTLRWRKPDSNHRSRRTRPAFSSCRFSFAPTFQLRGSNGSDMSRPLKPWSCRAGPTVRSRLPLAASLQTLGPSRKTRVDPRRSAEQFHARPWLNNATTFHAESRLSGWGGTGREDGGRRYRYGDPISPSRFCPAWYFVDLERENQNARRTAASNARQRTYERHRFCICPPQPNWCGPTAGTNLDCSSGPRYRWEAGGRTRQRANTRRPDPAVRPS